MTDKNIFCKAWLFMAMLLTWGKAEAQVGEYRNDFAVGVNAGITMSSISFVPKVPQDQLMGRTAGITLRYVGEKYFNSICAVVAEVNYAQIGWKESILTSDDQPVINGETGLAEEYSRQLDYIQVPVFARMGWGRERRGLQFFFQLGPQIGFLLKESAKSNFNLDLPNIDQRTSPVSRPDFSNMYHMSVENKIDYGLGGGGGLEFSHPRIGHFYVEGRYYFGLGNIYGNTKRDYFARSNIQNIIVKLTWLFDITKTKQTTIK